MVGVLLAFVNPIWTAQERWRLEISEFKAAIYTTKFSLSTLNVIATNFFY